MLKSTAETAETIARNTAVLLLSDVITKLLLFFYTIFVARYLGASGFGIISFALAFTGLFAVFADMGLGILTTREVARDKSLVSKYLNNNVGIKLILVVVTYAAVVIAINLTAYPPETALVVYITGASMLCFAFTDIFYSLFRAFERMEYVSIARIINAVALLCGALLVIYLDWGVIGVALVYLVASALMLGYSLVVFVIRFLVPKLEIDFSFWKWMLKEGWPFGLFAIVGLVATQIDRVMLSVMKGDEVVGYYEAAVSIAIALQFVPVAVINSFFPRLSEYYGHRELLENLARKMNRILFAIAILLTTGTFFFASRVIPVVYGVGFEESVIVLQILSVFLFVTYIPADGIVLNAIHKQQVKFYAGVAMMLTNVILNLIFIPKYGAAAAAVTTIFSYIVLRVGYVLLVRLQGLRTFPLDFSLLLITLTGIATGFIFGYLLSGLNVFLDIFLCAAVYFVITYFWFVKDDEREFINSLWRKAFSYLVNTLTRSRGAQ